MWNNKPKGELKLWKDINRDFIQLCAKNKIIFTLEVPITERALKIVKALGVKITLDIGHANMPLYRVKNASREDNYKYTSIAESIEKEHQLIANFHIHDNHMKEDEHLPPGEGTTDWPAIIDMIKKVKYEGPLTMEFMVYNFITLERGINYIRNLLEYRRIEKLNKRMREQ